MSPIVKVCGMRDAENIHQVEQLLTVYSSLFGCHTGKRDLQVTPWMGLIFWPKSSRYVSERPAYLPTKCQRVGVFVDATIEDVMQRVQDFGLDIVQLHGHETPDFIRQLKDGAAASRPCRGGHWGEVSIIKAFNIATSDDFAQTKAYEGLADYFLFDTRSPSVETGGSLPPGGTGRKFDWSVLADYVGETPFLLSGGIGPDDAGRVKAFRHAKCIGVDLNSRFESAPGLKDIGKLKTFLNYEQD